MVDMTAFANTDGKTTEEKLQDEIAGKDINLIFRMQDKPEETMF
jgi:hypothetical protein